MTLPNARLRQKVTGAPPPPMPPPGRQFGRSPAKTTHFLLQISLIRLKTALEPIQKAQMRGNAYYTTRPPSLPHEKEHFVSLSLHLNVPDTTQKTPIKWSRMCCLCGTTPKLRTGHILGYVAQFEFQGHLVNPQPPPPTSCAFQALELPNQTPNPLYSWPSVGPSRSSGRKCFAQSRSWTTLDGQTTVFGPR